MIRRIVWITLSAVLLTGLLLAGDISGTWTGTMGGGDNQFALTYKLKQDGAKLTGTVTGPGGEIPLSEGKVEGDKLSFTVVVDMNGSQRSFVSQGTIKGDEIVLETKGGDFTSPPMTLKRSK